MRPFVTGEVMIIRLVTVNREMRCIAYFEIIIIMFSFVYTFRSDYIPRVIACDIFGETIRKCTRMPIYWLFERIPYYCITIEKQNPAGIYAISIASRQYTFPTHPTKTIQLSHICCAKR